MDNRVKQFLYPYEITCPRYGGAQAMEVATGNYAA
jgi:hypothetical protein